MTEVAMNPKVEQALKYLIPAMIAMRPVLEEILKEENPTHEKLIRDVSVAIDALTAVAIDVKEHK